MTVTAVGAYLSRIAGIGKDHFVLTVGAGHGFAYHLIVEHGIMCHEAARIAVSAEEEHHDIIGSSLAIHLAHSLYNAVFGSIAVEQQRIFYMRVLRIEPSNGLGIVSRQCQVVGYAWIIRYTHCHEVYLGLCVGGKKHGQRHKKAQGNAPCHAGGCAAVAFSFFILHCVVLHHKNG